MSRRYHQRAGLENACLPECFTSTLHRGRPRPGAARSERRRTLTFFGGGAAFASFILSSTTSRSVTVSSAMWARESVTAVRNQRCWTVVREFQISKRRHAPCCRLSSPRIFSNVSSSFFGSSSCAEWMERSRTQYENFGRRSTRVAKVAA